MAENLLEIKKQLDEIKYPGSVVIKKSDSTGSESAKNGSAAPINDPAVNVQKKKEEAAQPEAASVPSQSQIRADAARKRLERLRTDYDAKVNARTDKQKEDQFYSDLMTGDPSVIAPIAAPDEEENRLRRQMEQADREAKYWEAEAEKERNQKVTEQDMADVQEWDEADREELEKYIQNREAARVQSFSPFATGLPTEYENSPLIDKYGRERLDEIARSYQREQNRQKYGQAEQTGREQVNGGLFSAIGANAASVGANIADTLLSPLQRVAQMAAGTDDRYSTLDPYAGGQAAAYASGVRQQSMENIEGEDPNLVRKGLSIGYQGTMAAADSLARAAVGGSSTVGMGLASLGSFNRTLTDASAKGASPDQALALAAINSGIEAATEKLPMDELFKLARSGAKPAAQVVKNVLKQMGIEILEEEASLIGTTLAEAAILQEKSGYNQQIMQAAAQGVPYEQAKADANRALLAEAINTALVSGVSGGISAGGAEIYAARFGGTETARQPEQTEPEPAPRKPEAAQAEEQTQTQENAEQPVQEAQEQPQAAQEAPTQAQPEQRSTVDVLTETITGKPANPAQTSTQQVDTQEQSAEGGQAEQTQKQTAPQTGDVKMQRARPDDVRPITVPVTDPQGKRVSEAAGNAQGSELTPDSMAKEIEQLVADGNLGFDVRTNRESLENAAAEINKKGPANVRNRITRSIESRKIKDGDIEQAILLYQKYANGDKDTDLDNASEMMVDLATMANITGRNLQLFKLLRKMTPEGQLLAVQKEVERNVQSLVSSGKVKKGYEAQIDESLKTEYLNAAKELQKAQKGEDAAKIAEAEQKVKDAQNAIYASEAAKMPATFKAKWDAWRYMAMLGNAKTQVRNVAGNLAFEPYKIVKDKMAALVEKSLPQDQRTKSLVQDPALLKWAREDRKTEDVTNALKYSAKLGDNTAKDQISEQMKVFDNKTLEAARKFVAKVPQAGDMLFKNDYYSRSLAGFLKARGYTAAQVQSGQVSNDILNEARTYAINEAMKATFNDSNAFSDAISSIGRGTQDNPWKKALNVAAEGILPFRRTPANIIVRFTEYSPAGIAKGMWDMATHVRNGDMSAATAIDQITAGLTGTGVMMLGYMMAAGMNGIKLTGSGADEDEKRQGHQDYALEFAEDGQEYSYKIDWAAPANLPLFVGANIYNAIKDAGADPDVSKLTAVIRGMGTAFEPMLTLSCLSSFNDLVEVRYAQEGEEVYNMAANIATSYFTQGIPALIRQGYQATQETKQTTFANDADPTIRDLQKTAANIPFAGAKFQTEKVNAWGETEDQGDWMTRTFNAFVNPGSLKKIDNSALEQEITRLKKAQTENVTPPTAGKTLSYTDKDGNAHKDVRLTEEQYQTLARTQGQTAKRILDEMIGSEDYEAMTDSQKAAAIRDVYAYARKTGEIAAIGDSHTGYEDAWMMELEEGEEADQILRRAAKAELAGAVSALDAAWDKNYDDTGRSDDLEWAYDAFKAMSPEAKREVREQATGTTAKYIEAREKGVSHTAFVSAAESIAKATGTGSNGSVRDIDRREAIASTRGLSEKSIDTIMKCYMEDYDPENGETATTELKYDYIRQELGLSPKQYTETYRAHLDNSKKADKIAAIMELGYDKKTATALYDVYAGTSKGKAAYMSLYED